MSSPVLARANSMDDVREVAPQSIDVESKEMRDSSKKTAESVTRSACTVAQAGISIGVTAAGHPEIAGLTVTGMKVGEEAAVACSKGIIEAGYCDQGLGRTRAMTNNCVIL